MYRWKKTTKLRNIEDDFESKINMNGQKLATRIQWKLSSTTYFTSPIYALKFQISALNTKKETDPKKNNRKKTIGRSCFDL